MDRHSLEQLEDKIGELTRFGSSSCMRQARSIMVENFNNVIHFALDLTKPKPKPKHTIADNYPAGGLTATEPCTFCKDYEKLESRLAAADAENERLKATLEHILEYWNKDENSMAMSDALWHILEVAEEALKEPK